MAVAKRSSWKTQALPAERAKLDYAPFFRDTEAEQLQLGLIPETMDDKWFVFSEEGWMYFHRSWTGYCIFWMRLDSSPAGVSAVEVWVNRDKSQYNYQNSEKDISLLDKLIKSVLATNRRTSE